MSQVAAVGEGNFEVEVMDASKEIIVVVDFWADWCPPCQMLSPVLESVAGRYENRLRFVKCNIDENQTTAEKYAIHSIPNLVFFREGQVINQAVGTMNETQLAGKIDEVLQS